MLKQNNSELVRNKAYTINKLFSKLFVALNRLHINVELFKRVYVHVEYTEELIYIPVDVKGTSN